MRMTSSLNYLIKRLEDFQGLTALEVFLFSVDLLIPLFTDLPAVTLLKTI